MDKIKLPKEFIDTMMSHSTMIFTADGSEYSFLPFWFKKTKDESVYEMHSLYQKLPKDLEDKIRSNRKPKITEE